MSKEHARMTKPQAALLAEIKEAGTLYIGRNQRYGRTILALEARGLVVKSAPDYSTFCHDGWSAVDDSPTNEGRS